jgi:hypothetical protein
VEHLGLYCSSAPVPYYTTPPDRKCSTLRVVLVQEVGYIIQDWQHFNTIVGLSINPNFGTLSGILTNDISTDRVQF